jgi:hypothetical protein
MAKCPKRTLRHNAAALPAAALDAQGNLAVAGGLHAGDQRRLLELSDGSEHLPASTAVGVSSAKWSGAVAGMSITPYLLEEAASIHRL